MLLIYFTQQFIPPLLQFSPSHDPSEFSCIYIYIYIFFFYGSLKGHNLYEIKFVYIINVFSVTFDQFKGTLQYLKNAFDQSVRPSPKTHV